MTTYSSQVYTLKLGKSKLLLSDTVKRHNTVHPLCTRLRATHVGLAEKLLWLYSCHLNKVQAYGAGIAEGKPLPPLRTNNVQLAGMMACSERTIHNLIVRLKASGIISRKVFKGSNSSYELYLSTSVLHIEHRGLAPDNRAQAFQFNSSQVPFYGSTWKTLPDTVTSIKQVTNKLNKLDGALFQQGEENQGVAGFLSVGNLLRNVENLNSLVENPHPDSEQGTKPVTQKTGYEHAGNGQITRPPVAPPPPIETAPNSKIPIQDPNADNGEELCTDDGPPRSLPSTPEEVLAGLPQKLQSTIMHHVTVLWISAQCQLYSDKWISGSEADRARAALAEYFRWTCPERYAAGTEELLKRITLVARWIKRGEGIDKKRWVPLPSSYFDHRNATGFTATKAWYKKHIVALSEIKSKELVTKAVKKYLRALDGKIEIGPADTYRIIAQQLGKISPALVGAFNRQVAGATQTAPN